VCELSVAPRLADSARDNFARVAVDVGHDHPCAFLSKSFGDRAADTMRGAGDDRHFV
jgi:hypothetical protein